MSRRGLAVLLVAASGGLLALAPACGNEENAYKPVPAWSGRKASLPSVPTLPSTPIKNGDAYTVYGAIHQLNSSLHAQDVANKDKPITIIGYIVDSNMLTVDKCAIHKTGKKDPEDCKTQIPTFWLSDVKGDKKQTIRVMGWASNFANVFDAWDKYKDLKDPPKELIKDELWAVDIPFPLPAVDDKVKITGHYGVNFGRSSTGVEADPVNGIMNMDKIEYVEPIPPLPATFPQLDKK